MALKSELETLGGEVTAIRESVEEIEESGISSAASKADAVKSISGSTTGSSNTFTVTKCDGSTSTFMHLAGNAIKSVETVGNEYWFKRYDNSSAFKIDKPVAYDGIKPVGYAVCRYVQTSSEWLDAEVVSTSGDMNAQITNGFVSARMGSTGGSFDGLYIFSNIEVMASGKDDNADNITFTIEGRTSASYGSHVFEVSSFNGNELPQRFYMHATGLTFGGCSAVRAKVAYDNPSSHTVIPTRVDVGQAIENSTLLIVGLEVGW